MTPAKEELNMSNVSEVQVPQEELVAEKSLMANRQYKDTVFRMLFPRKRIYCHCITLLRVRYIRMPKN